MSSTVSSLRHAALSAVAVVVVLIGVSVAAPHALELPTEPSSATDPLTPPPASAAPPAPAAASAAPEEPAASTAAPPPTSTRPSATARPSTRSTPSPTRSAPSSSRTAPATGVAGEILTLVNAERADAGCDPVRLDDRLTTAATRHSRDMADQDFLGHTGSDGDSFSERIRAAGHPSPRSENVAAGQESATEVVAAWLDSEGHRENILDCDARTMGVGRATGGSLGIYWTQDFGG